ncbi:MAG TPA: VanZ family protein [Edaphobacter sp.]|nr:VanZ family protein [Edaphobacter sp.]
MYRQIEKSWNLLTLPRLHFGLLIPSIALIVATTFIPVGIRHPLSGYIDYTFNSADFINNLILYVPLGFALGRSPFIRTFLFAFSLATCAELLQLGCVDRTPSPFDIAGNTCGALIGYLAAGLCIRTTGYYPKSLSVPRSIAAAAIPVAMLGTVILFRHRPSSDFSNWSPSFDLAIGNELTGGQPWDGTISGFAIYPFAMAPSSIHDLAGKTTSSPATAIVDALPDPPVFEWKPSADARTRASRSLLSKQQELSLYDTLVSANKLTLLVWMRTGNLEQSGPARIVTYSRDNFNRNFTLGQIQNTLTFRLRTPASEGNGTSPALYSGPVLSRNRTAFIAAVYDGRISRLYVDGKRVAQADLGAKRPRLPGRIRWRLPKSLPVHEIELSVSEILFSSLFALGVLGIVGTPRRRSMRALIGVLAGVAIGGTIWVFGVSETNLGIRILLECVAAGLVVSASVEPRAAGEPATVTVDSQEPSAVSC